ncbi:MAG TPA: periplasmic heavy metal sensor [Pseudolabrys sp.]|nr:periplasmic heavy metal sensor [Pseudolabrys sp.]
MSIAQYASSVSVRGSSRWLLLGSLALNLFFVGALIAMAVRSAPAPQAWDRDIFVRVERIAATLPPADAAILKDNVKAQRESIERTQFAYHTAQDSIHEMLRQEPFRVEAMRAAMTETRAARQTFYQLIQGIFAASAAQMSPAGRHALADWPPGRKPANNNTK